MAVSTIRWMYCRFYYENLKSRSKFIKRMGVTGDSIPRARASLLPQYHDCKFPLPLIGILNPGLFLSLAALSGSKIFDTCYNGKRCTGMLLCYLDGQIKVLGQWNASNSWGHCCIYGGSGAKIPDIYFRMSKSRDRRL